MAKGIEKPSDYYDLVPFRELPPGATRVYCAYPEGHHPRSVFHTDPMCPRLVTAYRLAVFSLADAVNYTIRTHRALTSACPFCVASREALRRVVREHDDYGKPILVQEALDA